MAIEFLNQALNYQYDDGGRAAAGFKGVCGDCGVRAAAIALSLPYKEVYQELFSINKEFLAKSRSARNKRRFSGSPRDGLSTDVMEEFMRRHGWEWVPTMRIGSGCTTHLYDMPMGSYVCRLANHYCAVVDRTIRDIFHDDEERCVYGYWKPKD